MWHREKFECVTIVCSSPLSLINITAIGLIYYNTIGHFHYSTLYTLKFITGGADIDAEWETYKSELEALGVDTMIELTQSALDRYYTK